jgi:hypothetical protein
MNSTDLINHDMNEGNQLQRFQEAITAGMESGISQRSLEEVMSEARELAAQNKAD